MSERDEFERWYSQADPQRHCAFERLVSDARYTSLEVEWAYRGFCAGRDLASEREREAVELLRVARCPECDGSGAVQYMANDGPDIDQCQWCHERDETLAAYDERNKTMKGETP